MALEAGMPLIGPNCMGIFSPAAGVRQNEDQYHGESGPVGFIGQSGTHTVYTSTTLNVVHGIKLAKSVSFGNAAVLEAADYLDYFAADPAVEIIGMYIEGVRDGRRFVRSLREAAAKKPVLIWKGGQTEQGARAAASHTASLAASAGHLGHHDQAGGRDQGRQPRRDGRHHGRPGAARRSPRRATAG